jgi:hypothetical protein
MTMRILSSLALAVGVLIFSTGGLLADDAPESKSKAKRGNPEAVFKRIDTNGDGKLSQEEFKAFIEKAMKGKIIDRPELVDKLFKRLDTDGDGFLNLEEFKKLRDLREKVAEKKKAKKSNEDAPKNE